MNGVHISFYLKTSRIHIFTETLRLIGCPKRICFLISADGQALLIRAHGSRDLKSHKVPQDVYDGGRSFEISSWKLCKILADLHSWDLKHSYRIPGVLMRDRRSVRFSLAKAEVIGKESS
ncbi:hypothetical protein [Oscillibacter sp.]|uniref:hypothetical protein n=1 Tax=Oscillibacter sp. TaxID=1945593 RepID=UPI002D7E2302|nr:hypothetical protein [Oscillibacter sp.]